MLPRSLPSFLPFRNQQLCILIACLALSPGLEFQEPVLLLNSTLNITPAVLMRKLREAAGDKSEDLKAPLKAIRNAIESLCAIVICYSLFPSFLFCRNSFCYCKALRVQQCTHVS
jgi:hypothetical protein